jgi:hypothetical protein
MIVKSFVTLSLREKVPKALMVALSFFFFLLCFSNFQKFVVVEKGREKKKEMVQSLEFWETLRERGQRKKKERRSNSKVKKADGAPRQPAVESRNEKGAGRLTEWLGHKEKKNTTQKNRHVSQYQRRQGRATRCKSWLVPCLLGFGWFSGRGVGGRFARKGCSGQRLIGAYSRL